MRIEDRLRESLRRSSTAANGEAPPEELWGKIQHGLAHRKRDVAVRVGTVTFALVASVAATLWLVIAFTGPRDRNLAHPTGLSVGDVRVFSGPGQVKVYGVLTNSGADPVGAAIACTLRDAAGRALGTIDGSVQYVAAASSEPFGPLGGSFPGTSTSATCQATSTPAVSPSPTAVTAPVFQPTAITFWDAQHGLATGWFGVPGGFALEKSLIQATDDGGRTWKTVLTAPPASAPIVDLDAVDQDHVWAVGGPCAMGTCDRKLLFSNDGGRTWTPIFTGSLEKVSFASASDGWAVGHLFPTGSQRLESTSDGGRTWRSTPVPCPRSVPFARDLSFISNGTQGWLLCAGEESAGQEGRAVLETIDGGRTWRTVAMAAPGSPNAGTGLTTSGYPTGIFFLSGGWIWQDRGSVLTSIDAGRTWTDAGISQPELNAVTSLWLTRDGRAFALRSGGGRTELISSPWGVGAWITVTTWGS